MSNPMNTSTSPTYTIAYDAETRDFAITRTSDGQIAGYARNYLEAERKIEELLAHDAKRAALAVEPPPAPGPVVVSTPAVKAAALTETLLSWVARAAATAQVTQKALEAVQAANVGGYTLVTANSDGTWSVRGRAGNTYTVTRAGMDLTCDCPHGQRVAVARCYHAVLAAGADCVAAELVQWEADDQAAALVAATHR